MILTETWLIETNIYPENFLSPKRKFYSKSRSSKTGVTKSGGVAIWVPRDISSKHRNDLDVLNEKFFESLWVEVSALSVSKILIKASYCPNKNYFIDELSTSRSGLFQPKPNSRGSNFSPSVEMDHCIVLYTTTFLVEPKNRKQSFINRNKRKFDANKFSLDLSNEDWSNLYQCEDGNSMYNVFINIFSTTL